MNKKITVRNIALLIGAMLCYFVGNAQINTAQVMAIGRNAIYFEDYVLSIQYFNQVIKVKPYLADPYFYRSVAKLSLEDYRGAEEDATAAIERNKFIVDAYQVRGIARQTLGKYSEAVDDYDKGLRYLPEDKGFLFNKAIAEGELKRYDAADSTYSKLIRLYPKYDMAYLGRAELNVQRGDSAKALADVDKGIEINKNNSQAYMMRADLRMNFKHDYESALNDMNDAIRLEPKKSDYFVNRAYIKYRSDDYYGAMADYDYAIDLAPNNVMARFNRGLLRMEVRDNNKAINDFNVVLEYDPGNLGALYNRAELYMQTRDYAKAAADYDRILSKVDDMPSLYYLRSEARRKAGDKKGAIADYDYFEKVRNAKVPEQNSADEAERIVEDEKKAFVELLTAKTDNMIAPQYEQKSRGKIQNVNYSINSEPMFVLTYYYVDNELKTRSHFTREVTDMNDLHTLPMALLLGRDGMGIDSNAINSRFASIEYYTSLIDRYPDRAINYFARAVDYSIVKNYAAAIADLNKAIALSPRFALGYFARATAKYHQMELDLVNEVQENTATDASRIRAAMRQSSTREIIADLDSVLRISPQMTYAHYNKGCVFMDMKDYTSAISAYSEALSQKPDFGEAYFNRGLCYFYLGNKEKGLADLSKAGEYGIAPSYSVIKRLTSMQRRQ